MNQFILSPQLNSQLTSTLASKLTQSLQQWPLTANTNQSTKQSPLGVINRQTSSHWHFLDGEDELTRSFELIKILRQHQTSNRWTLLIAPQHIPDKALLECCHVDMSHVLIVREKQISSIMETIETALKCRTCNAIVAWCNQWHNQLGGEKRNQLAVLASQAQCHVYAFEQKLSQPLDTEH